jgi:rhomboid protease GluP
MSDRASTFKVRFNFDPRTGDIPYNSLQLTGEGSFALGEGMFTVSASRHQLFGAGEPASHSFRLQDVFDVAVDGNKLAFSVLQPRPGGIVTLGFAARDAGTAREIAAAFPVRQTIALPPEEVERRAFVESLDSGQPRLRLTTVLVAINVVVFVVMVFAGASVGTGDPVIAAEWGSNVGALTLSGQWWRLVSSAFIHYGIIHLALNMLALAQVGRMVEQLFGTPRFAVLYFAAAVGGSLTSVLWHPDVNSAGASGAIFGLFGALLAFLVKPGNAIPKAVASAMRNQLVPVLLINLVFGLSQGIDYAAHVGGLATGFALGYWLAKPLGPQR